MSHNLHNLQWSFVGNPDIAVYFLQELKDRYNITPTRVYTDTDKPAGRKQILKSPAVASWSREHEIEVIQTNNLDDHAESFADDDLVCVFAYGTKISPRLLELEDTQFINVHPSLLPMYRGASPITGAILDDNKLTGVTLIEMIDEMDAGDIIGQMITEIDEWQKYPIIEKQLAYTAAELFVQAIPSYIAGDTLVQSQDSAAATYTRKYTKSDMQITSEMTPYEQYLY
jgi:methionyl-tRNA formyltransferase